MDGGRARKANGRGHAKQDWHGYWRTSVSKYFTMLAKLLLLISDDLSGPDPTAGG
jgi:hypothetical protein